MFLIKLCPGCGQKVRFPLDKGVIRVSCSCGHTFKVDPDDRALYIDATIDLTDEEKNPGINFRSAILSIENHIHSFLKRIKSFRININGFKNKAIVGFYNTKYWIQNYRLHPDSENRRIIVPILILLLAVAGIVFYLLLKR